MPTSPTHNEIVFRPPPGARFTLWQADVLLQFERGKEREVALWLEDWVRQHVWHAVRMAETAEVNAAEIVVGGTAPTQPMMPVAEPITQKEPVAEVIQTCSFTNCKSPRYAGLEFCSRHILCAFSGCVNTKRPDSVFCRIHEAMAEQQRMALVMEKELGEKKLAETAAMHSAFAIPTTAMVTPPVAAVYEPLTTQSMLADPSNNPVVLSENDKKQLAAIEEVRASRAEAAAKKAAEGK